jgi:hypothetical protein
VRGTFAEIVLVDVETMPVTPLFRCRLLPRASHAAKSI